MANRLLRRSMGRGPRRLLTAGCRALECGVSRALAKVMPLAAVEKALCGGSARPGNGWTRPESLGEWP